MQPAGYAVGASDNLVAPAILTTSSPRTISQPFSAETSCAGALESAAATAAAASAPVPTGTFSSGAPPHEVQAIIAVSIGMNVELRMSPPRDSNPIALIPDQLIPVAARRRRW